MIRFDGNDGNTSGGEFACRCLRPARLMQVGRGILFDVDGGDALCLSIRNKHY